MLQASLNNKLQLVNFESGKVAKTYSGHKNSKYCSMSTFVTILGPRPCIAAGSEDGSIHFWDVNSRKVCCWWQRRLSDWRSVWLYITLRDHARSFDGFLLQIAACGVPAG
jgi:WD40 repeat protein